MDTPLTKRYNDQIYASRAQLKNILGADFSELLWQSINEYRRIYQIELPLIKETGVFYRLTMTPGFLQKLGLLESKSLSIIKRINACDRESLFACVHERELLAFAEAGQLLITKEQLRYLLKTNDPVSALLAPLVGYAQARTNVYTNPRRVTLAMLTWLWHLLDASDDPLVYRQCRLKTGNQWTGKELEEQVRATLSFNENQIIPLLLTRLCVWANLLLLVPVEHHHEELATFLFSQLVNDYFEPLGNFLPLLMCLKQEEDKFMLALNEVNSHNDLTYLVHYLANCYEAALEFVIQNMPPQEEREVENNETIEAVEVASEIAPVVVRLSTPFLPSDTLSEEEFEAELLARLPEIKATQACFLARNRNPEHFYSIRDYQQLTGVSYETARQGLEMLTALGYYRRQQYRNKHYYRFCLPVKENN